MTTSDQFLLTYFLSHNVRCDKGIDHGIGILPWMHPPVHRILGWITRPSLLRLSRHVWQLNQFRGNNNNWIYVKGNPYEAEQTTIERLPSLLDANLLNLNSLKIGNIVDFLFDSKTGNILYYLVSRSDPRIPGSSRWKLSIDHIIDQQPGIVSTDCMILDDMPIIKSSIRRDLIKKSKHFRDQFQDISDKATLKLEGWLEEDPFENFNQNNNYVTKYPSKDNWIDEMNEDYNDEIKNSRLFNRKNVNFSNTIEEEEDPWV